jgi:hypothetical protein
LFDCFVFFWTMGGRVVVLCCFLRLAFGCWKWWRNDGVVWNRGEQWCCFFGFYYWNPRPYTFKLGCKDWSSKWLWIGVVATTERITQRESC